MCTSGLMLQTKLEGGYVDCPQATRADGDICARKRQHRQITAYVKAQEQRYTCDEDHMVCVAGGQAVRKRGIEV